MESVQPNKAIRAPLLVLGAGSIDNPSSIYSSGLYLGNIIAVDLSERVAVLASEIDNRNCKFYFGPEFDERVLDAFQGRPMRVVVYVKDGGFLGKIYEAIPVSLEGTNASY